MMLSDFCLKSKLWKISLPPKTYERRWWWFSIFYKICWLLDLNTVWPEKYRQMSINCPIWSHCLSTTQINFKVRKPKQERKNVKFAFEIFVVLLKRGANVVKHFDVLWWGRLSQGWKTHWLMLIFLVWVCWWQNIRLK